MTTATMEAPEAIDGGDEDQAPGPAPAVTIVAPRPAPYGVKADGTARRKPGPPPGPRKSSAPKVSAPPRSRSTSSAPKGPDYATAVAGLLQLPAAGLALAGMRRPELRADAAALALYTPPISAAVGQLARDHAQVAAVLDKLLSVGPYGALIAAVSPLILQVMCNHGMIPAGALGTMDPEQLIAQVA